MYKVHRIQYRFNRVLNLRRKCENGLLTFVREKLGATATIVYWKRI